MEPNNKLPGVSHPAKILASDGKIYFLKGHFARFQDGKLVKLEAALAQELFSYQIAQKLSIPTPKIALIEIDEKDLTITPSLRFEHHFEQPGIYFATEAVENCNNNFKVLIEQKRLGIPGSAKKLNTFLSKIENKNAIPNIMYFDLLTANMDRYSNVDNLIFKTTNTGQYLLAIDFGYCFFGPYWKTREYITNLSKIDLLKFKTEIPWEQLIPFTCFKNSNQDDGVVFKSLEKFVSFEKNPFEQVHSSALKLTSNQVSDMLRSIPNEWLSEENYQRSIYLNFILGQIKRMPDILNYATKNYFKNYAGGDLIWPREQNILTQ